MSLAISRRSALTLAAVTAVTGVVAYAVYFDYKRRNDATFRRKLRKEKKRVERAETSTSTAPTSSRSLQEIQEALQLIRNEQLPATPDEKEKYFMENLGMGEQLSAQGPMFEVAAALHFYRALRVYPSPVDLIVVFQKTIPENIFKIVMEMTSIDVKQRAEGYFDEFPSPSYNVTVKGLPRRDGGIDGSVVNKNVLLARKDFEEGDVIYKEVPVVASIDSDLEGTSRHCSHCFREISDELAIRPDADPLGVAYCSKACENQAILQHQELLFGSGVSGILQDTIQTTPSPSRAASRKSAQTSFIDLFKSTGSNGMMLVARFIARMVADETKKLQAQVAGGSTEKAEVYTLFDHVERLRYLEFSEIQTQAQKAALTDVLKNSAEGLEEFLKEDRYGVLLGKMAYNAIGVVLSGGRNDRPSTYQEATFEEKTRTPAGTQRQIGCGLYLVSSYMAHSCSPNTAISFPAGTNELHLIANRNIKAGDELTTAYVDVRKPEDEEVLIARRSRRQELAKGWRFACFCGRCEMEAPDLSTPALAKADEVEVKGPSAQVEKAVDHFESGKDNAESRMGSYGDDVE